MVVDRSVGGALDADTILRASRGDPTALRRVVDTLTPAVQTSVAGTLLRHTSSKARSRVRHEVEDLTQDVLFALLAAGAKRLRAWDPDKGLSLDQYVQLVARHLVVSFLRRRARRVWENDPVDDEPYQASDAEEEKDSPERIAEKKELGGAVLAAVEADLSPQGRRMLEMLVEGLSVVDVCARTSLTPNAVHVWRSRLVKLAEVARRRILRGEPADG